MFNNRFLLTLLVLLTISRSAQASAEQKNEYNLEEMVLIGMSYLNIDEPKTRRISAPCIKNLNLLVAINDPHLLSGLQLDLTSSISWHRPSIRFIHHQKISTVKVFKYAVPYQSVAPITDDLPLLGDKLWTAFGILSRQMEGWVPSKDSEIMCESIACSFTLTSKNGKRLKLSGNFKLEKPLEDIFNVTLRIEHSEDTWKISPYYFARKRDRSTGEALEGEDVLYVFNK